MENQQLTAEAEKAIDRVTKLLALAKNNDNEAEATSAMDAAMRILEAYNLDMALVERRSGQSSARKREDQKTGGGLYKWQRTLWENVATLNFCRYAALKGLTAGSKYENRVIGSNVNVLSTTLMADYLQATIERLAAQWVRDHYAPGKSRFIRDAIAYREGMADRIAERLRSKRWEREEEERRARAAMPKGDGTALVLADVIHAEQDANDDVYHGLEPGTHATWRAERDARIAAANAAHAAVMAARNEREAADPALKAKRVAEEAAQKVKDEAENAKYWAKQGKKEYKYREPKVRSHTYYAGHRDGADISLDKQVEDRKQTQRRIG